MLQWDVISDADRVVLSDPRRLRSVRRIAGGPLPDDAFDRVAMLVRKLVDAPICAVCLVGDDRQILSGQTEVTDQMSSAREMPLTH